MSVAAKMVNMTSQNCTAWIQDALELGMTHEEASWRKWNFLKGLDPQDFTAATGNPFNMTCALCTKYLMQGQDYEGGVWGEDKNYSCGPCPLAEGFETDTEEVEQWNNDEMETDVSIHFSPACSDYNHTWQDANHGWITKDKKKFQDAATKLAEKLYDICLKAQVELHDKAKTTRCSDCKGPVTDEDVMLNDIDGSILCCNCIDAHQIGRP